MNHTTPPLVLGDLGMKGEKKRGYKCKERGRVIFPLP
jgi:hypothetical protein